MPVNPVLVRLRRENNEVEASLACIAWAVFQTLDCVVTTQTLDVFVAPEDAGWLAATVSGSGVPAFSPTASLGE